MGGLQKLFYLPEPHTDFIYAVIAEELGLIGATLTLLAFVVITWRGLRVAGRAPDQFGAFLAIGLTGMMAVQAFINLSVVLGHGADQGHPAAVRELRRVVAADQPGRHGDPAERVAARVGGA